MPHIRIESTTLDFDEFPEGTRRIRLYFDDGNYWRVRCYDAKGNKLANVVLMPNHPDGD